MPSRAASRPVNAPPHELRANDAWYTQSSLQNSSTRSASPVFQAASASCRRSSVIAFGPCAQH